MNRGPYSYACCCNRMGEFYSFDDMDHYVHNININHLDVHEAMCYLDMQTRVNYVTGVDDEPDIDNYLLRFLLAKGYEPGAFDNLDEE